MDSLNRSQDPSLRFLLWLEWILIGLTALGEVRIRFQLFETRSPILSLICLLLLALLGRRLPQSGLRQKLLYSGINLFLVLLASTIGYVQYFFLLFIVLMLRSCQMFNTRGRWLTMAVLLIIFATVQSHRISLIGQRLLNQSLQHNSTETIRPLIIGATLLFALGLLFLQLMFNALVSERHSRSQLASANQQLRQYAHQIEAAATLEERTRIAREIHDSLGHSLTALTLNLNAALGLWEADPDETKALLSEAKSLSHSALQDVRQAAATLRTSPLDQKPLATLIKDLVDRLKKSSTIQINDSIQLEKSPNNAQKLAVYRIVQEALTNVVKHAEATQVNLRIQQQEQRWILQIEDDGKGFDRQQTTSGYGLRGMEERAQAVNATLSIRSKPGKGCCITVKIPVTEWSQ